MSIAKIETAEETHPRISEAELRAHWEREHNTGPGLTLVAGWPMFSPTAKPDLTDDLWAALLLIQSDDEVENDEIIAFIARAESHMGTTDMHRIDAKEAAGLFTAADADAARRVIRAKISAEKRRHVLDQSRHAASLDGSTRDPATVLELARLEGKLRDAEVEAESLRAIDAKRHRKEIKRLENKARELTDELTKLQDVERDAYAILGEAREPVLRALQRGEIITAKEAETADFARDEHGARIINRGGPMRGLPALVYSRGLRAKNLTGIEHAFHSGHLRAIRGVLAEEHLLRIGQEYGAAYEIVEGQATNAGEGGGGFKPKAPLPRAIEAGETLADMRKGLNDRQRKVMDLVCGHSLRAREAATQLHAGFPATIRALVGGLKAAETSRLAERERREQNGVMPVGVRVHAVNQMLRRVRA